MIQYRYRLSYVIGSMGFMTSYCKLENKMLFLLARADGIAYKTKTYESYAIKGREALKFHLGDENRHNFNMQDII